MAQGITGWRLHIGFIYPTPVPPRPVLEFYEMAPPGIDMTTVSLSVQQISDEDMDQAIAGMERAAKQLSNYDIDIIYQLGVPPIVRRDPGFHKELEDRLSQASGLPAMTDMGGVLAAMRACKMETIAMATPFQQVINDRLVKYFAKEGIEIVHNEALGILRNTEIRRLPIPLEYQTARKAFAAAKAKPDGLYVPCGGWGSIRNIAPLERDCDTTVITWMNTMLWAPMRRMRIADRIEGFGKLLASAAEPAGRAERPERKAKPR